MQAAKTALLLSSEQPTPQCVEGAAMDLDQLSKHIKAGEIEELDLVSIEGGSYVIHARMNGQSHAVSSPKGGVLHVASVDEARKCLSSMKEVPLFIVHPVVYDEMVGHAESDKTVSRQPIPFRSSL
jgi:butyrate kinase